MGRVFIAKLPFEAEVVNEVGVFSFGEAPVKFPAGQLHIFCGGLLLC